MSGQQFNDVTDPWSLKWRRRVSSRDSRELAHHSPRAALNSESWTPIVEKGNWKRGLKPRHPRGSLERFDDDSHCRVKVMATVDTQGRGSIMKKELPGTNGQLRRSFDALIP